MGRALLFFDVVLSYHRLFRPETRNGCFDVALEAYAKRLSDLPRIPSIPFRPAGVPRQATGGAAAHPPGGRGRPLLFASIGLLLPRSGRALRNAREVLLREARAVVAQPPAPGPVHLAAADRDDEVRKPRPCVLPVELAGLGGMVGMRMVGAHHRQTGGARLLVRGEHRLGFHHEAVVPAVLPLVGGRHDAIHPGRAGPLLAEQEAAALLGVGPHRMAADRVHVGGGHRQGSGRRGRRGSGRSLRSRRCRGRRCPGIRLGGAPASSTGRRLGDPAHGVGPSSQKPSERYLSAPSQRTVTMVPAAPRGTSSATASAAATLAPAETPTRNPTSRARRHTIAYAASVAI